MTQPGHSNLGRLIRATGTTTGVLTLVVIAGTVAETLFPAALGIAVDALLGGDPSRPVAICAGLVGVTVICSAIEEWATGASAARAAAYLRRQLVDHVLSIGARRFPSGDLVSRIGEGAAEAGQAPAAIATGAAAVIPVAGGLAALAIIDPWLIVAFIVAGPLIAGLLVWFVRRTSDVTARYLQVQGSIAARLVDALTGSRTIAAAGTVERESDRVLRPLPELSALGREIWQIQGRAQSRGVLIVPLVQIAVLGVAGFGLLAGRITPGELLAASQYVLLASGIGPITGSLSRLARARAGARRVADVLETPPIRYGSRHLPAGPGRVAFRGVVSGDVLTGLDLDIPGGSSVAIVGRSGTGKSRIAALCGRLTDPDGGEVLIDGVPVAELTRPELRRAVGYAFDRPALLGDRIGDVIDFGIAVPTPGERRAAAQAACIEHVVERLPYADETPVADAPMSGGEIQRLGLARAFAHATRVLVLDDAMASLDTATEVRIRESLAVDLAARTKLIITHRAATAAGADAVAWIDGGRVRAYGPHRSLWRDPAYREVFAET